MAKELPIARILQVDDNETYFEVLLDILSGKPGHEVVLTAGTVAQALSFVPDKLLDMGINVAVLDNKLPGGTGLLIATKIRETILGLSIVSFSATEGQTWGDFNILKPSDLSIIRNTIQKAVPLKPPVRRS